MKKTKKGFTLTELIIVIVIIGILAAVLIPSLSSYVKKAKISKGTQNARNMTTLLIGEVLFNDKEYLMPNEVVSVAQSGGYDLISEVEGYAYWYDSSTNTVKFEELNSNVSAALDGARGRIECLSATHPEWFYIDQTDNALKETIDTVNNLVKLGFEDAGITEYKQITEDKKTNVLNAMDNRLYSLINKLKDVNGINNDTKNSIVSFVSSFNTTDTIYYDSTGAYNKALSENSSENGTNSATVVVERAMVTNNTTEIPEDTQYESIDVVLVSPLYIPSNVQAFDEDVLANIIKGTVCLSKSSNIDLTAFNDGVNVSSIASIKNISYKTLNVDPNYDKIAYRFKNGLTFTVNSDEELFYDKTTKVLVVKKDKTYSYYDNKSGETGHLTYEYNADNKKGTCYSGSYTLPTSTVNLSQDEVLSKYYIPTIEIEKNTKGLDFAEFISLDYTGFTSNISIRTTNSISAVKYTAVMVNADDEGYKIDNIGYITDILYDVYQQKEVKEDNITSYTINGNTESKITINLPEAARGFTNYQNVTVNVEYVLQHVEYEKRQIGSYDLYVSTGNIYTDTKIKSVQVYGNSVDGFEAIIDLSNMSFEDNGETYKPNQIKITKITVSTKIDESTIDLFTRYFD